jgi:hypothetical protein
MPEYLVKPVSLLSDKGNFWSLIYDHRICHFTRYFLGELKKRSQKERLWSLMYGPLPQFAFESYYY